MTSRNEKLSFSGHETFPMRYTWPAKTVRGVLLDPGLFSRDDALVTLGVGKNMVRSMRHWAETLGLVCRSASTGPAMQPTDFGSRLFGPNGWDPFLENPGTLWLLHWKLVSQRNRASSWHLLFTQWGSNSFTRDQLVDWLSGIAEQAGSRSSPNSIKRDVDVLIRTYVPSKASRNIPLEDTFDSPFVELGLLTELEKGVYSFRRGVKPSLPSAIFLFALLEFWDIQASERKSLAFESLLYGPGSPGGSFKLTENALAERLERLPKKYNLYFDETAGMRILYGNPDISSNKLLEILEAYYRGKRKGVAN